MSIVKLKLTIQRFSVGAVKYYRPDAEWGRMI